MARHRRAATPPPPEQIRCSECHRWRLKGRACQFCNLPDPAPCSCDVIPIDSPAAVVPDSHRHILHVLLALIHQREVEATDEWILQPADSVKAPARPHWSDNPELLPHLAEHPVLRSLCSRGTETVYGWADVTKREAAAFDMHLIGWADEVIAWWLDEYLPTDVLTRASSVPKLYGDAEWRIRSALALVEGGEVA